MKKLLSLLLSCLLIVSCMVGLALPASADGTTIDAMPTALPNGNNIDITRTWVDWSKVGVYETSKASVEADGMYKVITVGANSWSGTGNTNISHDLWHGASGIMFFVDATDLEKVDFILTLLSTGERSNSSGASKQVQLNTSPYDNLESSTYYYNGTSWGTPITTTSGYLTNDGESLTGWYYVPFTSFYYKGGGATMASGDVARGKNFVEFMENFAKATVYRLGIQSSVAGLKFGDIHLVYDETPADLDDQYSTASLFTNMGKSAVEPTTGAAFDYAVDGNSVTISGMNVNSTTSSSNRLWLNGFNVNNLKGATGLRFYVDTSEMADGAALQLRIRLQSNVNLKASSLASSIYGNGAVNYVSNSSVSYSYPQFVCRAGNSVAYYYDNNGSHTLNVMSSATNNNEADLFEALPPNFEGYVYIPFDSFIMSTSSYKDSGCLSFSKVAEYHPLHQITICHDIANYTTGSDAVTYSDFEVVYEDTAFSGTSVSLANNLNLNFYANIQDDATLPTLKYSIAGTQKEVNGEKVENGVYKFVCEDILPQMMSDNVEAMLTAKVGSYTVSASMNCSIRDYCEDMLAKDSSSEELKKLLVDLLYYGEAAQNYAQYKTDDLATKNLTEEQKALRSADATGAITAQIAQSGTANESYQWQSTSLLLENALAIKLKFYAEDSEGLVAKVTLNGRTTEYSEFEGSGVYEIVFRNIGAAELDDEITLVLEKNGETVGQTVTCSVAAYIKTLSSDADDETLNLLRSIYSYGQSAAAYNPQ